MQIKLAYPFERYTGGEIKAPSPARHPKNALIWRRPYYRHRFGTQRLVFAGFRAAKWHLTRAHAFGVSIDSTWRDNLAEQRSIKFAAQWRKMRAPKWRLNSARASASLGMLIASTHHVHSLMLKWLDERAEAAALRLVCKICCAHFASLADKYLHFSLVLGTCALIY